MKPVQADEDRGRRLARFMQDRQDRLQFGLACCNRPSNAVFNNAVFNIVIREARSYKDTGSSQNAKKIARNRKFPFPKSEMMP
jgi:hypothetical protein